MTVPYRRAAPWTFLVYWIVLALAGCGRQILWPPSGPWRRGGRGRGCWSWWPSKATLYPHCVQSKKTKSLKTISKAAERLIIRKLVMNPRDFNWRGSLLQPFLTTRGKQKPSIYFPKAWTGTWGTLAALPGVRPGCCNGAVLRWAAAASSRVEGALQIKKRLLSLCLR